MHNLTTEGSIIRVRVISQCATIHAHAHNSTPLRSLAIMHYARNSNKPIGQLPSNRVRVKKIGNVVLNESTDVLLQLFLLELCAMETYGLLHSALFPIGVRRKSSIERWPLAV